MFQDLGELEAVFDQLNEDSESPTEEKLNWVCDSNSEFNKRLNKLILAIEEHEAKAGVKLGASHQSSILADLLYYLKTSSKPSKLKANLSKLKELLIMSMVISVELKADTLRLLNKQGMAMAEKGKAFTGNSPGLSTLSKIIVEILKDIGKNATSKAVWKELKKMKNNKKSLVIDEVVGDGLDIENDAIFWVGAGGKSKETKFRSFENNVSRLRKRI